MTYLPQPSPTTGGSGIVTATTDNSVASFGSGSPQPNWDPAVTNQELAQHLTLNLPKHMDGKPKKGDHEL